MLKQKTLLVIGAGTSCEFGLPAGGTLRDIIAEKVGFNRRESGDELIREYIGGQQQSAEVFKAAGRLSDGLRLASSIDSYLHTHRADTEMVRIGKLGIARSILDAEKDSSLAFSRGELLDFHKPHPRSELAPIDTWLGWLWQALHDGVSAGSPEAVFENLAIVNFNYDRCVEHFLFNILQTFFSITSDAAARAMEHLVVLHPYGMVGPLPWQGVGIASIAFGDNRGGTKDMVASAACIRTYTEQVRTLEEGQKVLGAVMDAEQILFLGFGFHAQNMDLLMPGPPTPAQRVFATTHGQSMADVRITKREIAKTLSGRASGADQKFDEGAIELSHLEAGQFVKDHQRTLRAQAIPMPIRMVR